MLVLVGHRLREAGLLGSVGRVDASVENGLMESFWSTQQRELLDRHDRQTQAELGPTIFEWMEGFYNTRHHHSGLGHLSPVEFENPHPDAASAA